MSHMFKKVVVGTDGTESSHLAVRRAAGIAAAFGGELILASAYYAKEDEALASQRNESQPLVGGDHAEQVLASAIEIAKEAGVAEPKAVLRRGSPVDALMAVVTEMKADLLVVGNRGINSLTGRLLGSVPADVARQSDCDVMIVHTVD